MKCRLLAACLLVTTAFADVDRHRQAATELLAMAGGPEMLMGGMEAMLEPMEAMWRQQGAPDEVVATLRQVTRDWMTEDIKWSELEPRFVDLYVREFSESELREVIAFYKTSTGQKALKRLPALMAECAKIGQEYGVTKQDALRIRMEAALQKFKPEAAKK
jgi:hypothetical protein